MEGLIFLLVIFVTPFALGFGISALFARTVLRGASVGMLGVLLAAGLFLGFYLLSDTEMPASCSDCEELWGRWWEPGLAAFWATCFLGFWIAGAIAGRFAALLRRPRSS
jgi:hypothetical protein